MLRIYPGMTRASLSPMEQLEFDKYDKNQDGVIGYAEYCNFLSVTNVGKIQNKTAEKTDNKGFDLEQFEPQGSINFESNGGFNAKKLNIIA